MNRNDLIRELRAIVGERYLLTEKADVIVYEQDGSIMQVTPEVVVLPATTAEVAAAVGFASVIALQWASTKVRVLRLAMLRMRR